MRTIAAITFAMALCAASLVSFAQDAHPDGPPGPAPQQQRQQGAAGAPGGGQQPARPPEGLPPLPADSTTRHTVTINGQPREFVATAGKIRLMDAQSGAPQADIAFIAFRLETDDVAKRPVSFVFNGGPGYASAWLNLGGLGPWRLPMEGEAVAPSAPPVVVDNPDTWLAFTDLVFIDPAGTGYSRVLGGDEVRKSFWSVNGDISSLAVTIRRWVEANGRSASPKFIVGESYGGFRAPKIARVLQVDQGVGVDGLVMIAPVLDFGAFDAGNTVLTHVARLPSFAATARERKGRVTREDMRDVEAYATGEFLADLVKGFKDADALARLTRKVSELTGLDTALVERLGGRIPTEVFAREINRAQKRVSSLYDGAVTSLDAHAETLRGASDDAMRLGLHAPLTQAMVDIYRNRLKWVVENGRYMFLNEQAGRQWEGRARAEAVEDLRRDLALDPRFRVLITHGLTDLVTPYFGTKLALDQIPDIGAPERVKLVVYPGGHMSYSRDDTRRRLRDDARALVEGK